MVSERLVGNAYLVDFEVRKKLRHPKPECGGTGSTAVLKYHLYEAGLAIGMLTYRYMLSYRALGYLGDDKKYGYQFGELHAHSF